MSKTNAEALREAANAWREYLPAVAGYGAVQPVPVWLERRAQWLERRAQWLESLEPVEITYKDIKAGDIIKIDYGYGFSVGVALYEEPLYDDPERPERMWRFDGMDFLGCSTGNWMGGGMTRISELEFSEYDEKARGWKRKEQEDRDE